jgi:hypothetical protein
MTKKLFTVMAVLTLALGLTACTENLLDNPPGRYENSITFTDADGTTTERRSSTQIAVDEYGRRKAIVKSTTTKDPKGLFNKTTTSQFTQAIDAEL